MRLRVVLVYVDEAVAMGGDQQQELAMAGWMQLGGDRAQFGLKPVAPESREGLGRWSGAGLG